MVCDYFYPKIGGVESHIYSLAEALARRHHKVIVITHAYPARSGVRYLPYGVKVYHIPVQPLPPTHVHATLPAFFTSLPYVRNIILREQIEIVHAHASLSALGMEVAMHASTLGIKSVFTDHSLFGLGNMAEAWGNKMLKGCLSNVDAVICVSEMGKQNTTVRGALDPDIVHVIPNAIVAANFKPAEPVPPLPEILTLVCISRLVYRKGMDLLIAALPKVCELHPDVKIIIGGDGPKIIELEQMRDKYQDLLGDRVELLGAVKHEDVSKVLSRAHIFVNPSLTEAFGISILEAACSGLFVVSTRVGGVPEVLPPHLVEFAEPNPEELIKAISRGIAHVRAGKHDPIAAHETLRGMYSWSDVAKQTEGVYESVLELEKPPLIEQLRRYYGTGLIFGKMLALIACVDLFLLAFLDFFYPREEIDLAPKFDVAKWEQRQRFLDLRHHLARKMGKATNPAKRSALVATGVTLFFHKIFVVILILCIRNDPTLAFTHPTFHSLNHFFLQWSYILAYLSLIFGFIVTLAGKGRLAQKSAKAIVFFGGMTLLFSLTATIQDVFFELPSLREVCAASAASSPSSVSGVALPNIPGGAAGTTTPAIGAADTTTPTIGSTDVNTVPTTPTSTTDLLANSDLARRGHDEDAAAVEAVQSLDPQTANSLSSLCSSPDIVNHLATDWWLMQVLYSCIMFLILGGPGAMSAWWAGPKLRAFAPEQPKLVPLVTAHFLRAATGQPVAGATAPGYAAVGGQGGKGYFGGAVNPQMVGQLLGGLQNWVQNRGAASSSKGQPGLDLEQQQQQPLYDFPAPPRRSSSARRGEPVYFSDSDDSVDGLPADPGARNYRPSSAWDGPPPLYYAARSKSGRSSGGRTSRSAGGSSSRHSRRESTNW